MGKKFDWYKRNPAKFFGGTIGMTFEVKASYGLVLDLIYDRGDGCPDDGPWIANMLGVGMTTRRWGLIRAELIARGKLYEKDGLLRNATADRELYNSGVNTSPEQGNVPRKKPEKTGDKIEIIPVASPETKGLGLETPPTKPVAPRAGPRENQNQSQNEIRPDALVIAEVEQIATVLRQDRGRYWETDYRSMIASGLSFENILDAARAHRGGAIKSIKSLSGLALKKQSDRGAAPPSTTQAVTTMSPKDWERALVSLCERGVWDKSKLGDPPTRPTHRVPLAMYGRWLAVWQAQGKHPARELDDGSNLVEYPALRADPFMRAMWEP